MHPRGQRERGKRVHDALIRGADSAVLVRPGPEGYRTGVAKRVKQLRQDRGSVLFDAVFDAVSEDGGRALNRRVPMEILGGSDGDGPVRAVVEHGFDGAFRI